MVLLAVWLAEDALEATRSEASLEAFFRKGLIEQLVVCPGLF